MSEEEFGMQLAKMRALVVQRLADKRWISEAILRDQSTIPYELKWTEAGIANIRLLHVLLGELGYFPGPNFGRGELDFLAALIGQYGKPPPNIGSSVIPENATRF